MMIEKLTLIGIFVFGVTQILQLVIKSDFVEISNVTPSRSIKIDPVSFHICSSTIKTKEKKKKTPQTRSISGPFITFPPGPAASGAIL